jgi:hypothetical protein
VKANTTYTVGSFDHYSLLAGIEDTFGVPRLGYASDDQLPVIDDTVYGAGVPAGSAKSARSASKRRARAKRHTRPAAAPKS